MENLVFGNRIRACRSDCVGCREHVFRNFRTGHLHKLRQQRYGLRRNDAYGHLFGNHRNGNDDICWRALRQTRKAQGVRVVRIHRLGAYHNVVCGNSYARRLAYSGALRLFACPVRLRYEGSTAYDAAFITWTTDVTDDTNRGKVNTVLSVLPVFATVIVFIGLGSLYKPTNESNWLFFIVLGIIPIVAGILAIFMMKDSTHIVKNQNPNFLKETFYGFRKQVIKDNRMLYVCLATSCILGISQQTFFSYLINFVQNTLELGDNFVVPLAVVIIGAAVFTGVMGVLFDKLGRKHFYLPLLTVIVACTLIVYLMEFMPKAAWLPVLYVAGIFMLGAILSLSAALMASFQDYIPTGTEGRFQGVRMCFNVLLPMIIGPLITLIIGLSDVDTSAAGFTPPFKIFLAASIVALLAFLPLYFVRKDSDRLRLTLSEKRENAAAEAAQPEESAEIAGE